MARGSRCGGAARGGSCHFLLAGHCARGGVFRAGRDGAKPPVPRLFRPRPPRGAIAAVECGHQLRLSPVCRRPGWAAVSAQCDFGVAVAHLGRAQLEHCLALVVGGRGHVRAGACFWRSATGRTVRGALLCPERVHGRAGHVAQLYRCVCLVAAAVLARRSHPEPGALFLRAALCVGDWLATAGWPSPSCPVRGCCGRGLLALSKLGSGGGMGRLADAVRRTRAGCGSSRGPARAYRRISAAIQSRSRPVVGQLCGDVAAARAASYLVVAQLLRQFGARHVREPRGGLLHPALYLRRRGAPVFGLGGPARAAGRPSRFFCRARPRWVGTRTGQIHGHLFLFLSNSRV